MGTQRVGVTPEAADLLRRLRADHDKPLMFHQSGGCCDGSAPMCYTQGTFLTGSADVLLGELEVGTPEPVPVWISKAQFDYWSHTHITIDVVPGRGAGFSIEGPTGHRFIIRSRVFTEEETADLAPVRTG
ncbi:DUF779 domain-containing protein [Aeromicrobium phragmitis]|uniref:DUF779 domain-containing protein n=1 Tax=Aeromicrobium phragmitis TaxID=2478914 RepID=A0A3L8PIQ7_9ACTN|nr:DUF779 domain-containing protein [Aeromicrobium phragmitis]RLV55060.1 DUF779 domain-containing protein [Aeromicrobium phragmitis]